MREEMRSDFIGNEIRSHIFDVNTYFTIAGNRNQGKLIRVRQIESQTLRRLLVSKVRFAVFQRVELPAAGLRLQIAAENQSQGRAPDTESAAIGVEAKAVGPGS